MEISSSFEIEEQLLVERAALQQPHGPGLGGRCPLQRLVRTAGVFMLCVALLSSFAALWGLAPRAGGSASVEPVPEPISAMQVQPLWPKPRTLPGSVASTARVVAAGFAKGFHTLLHADEVYSESTARAFATMAKLSYCGSLPGLPAAVTASCSSLELPGSTTACERARFGIMPGTVRIFSADDFNVMDSLFGFIAEVKPTGPGSSVENGILISFRGSIDNFANNVRDKQTMLAFGLSGCLGCGVHQGYHQIYRTLEWQLKLHLSSLLCSSATCAIYVTGHGSGAAVAAIAAWELACRGYTIGTSYLFELPKIGNAAFAKQMTDNFSGHGRHGMIFSITHGHDSVPRWPFDSAFKAWGLEAHYPDMAFKHSPLCFAGSLDCGVGKTPTAALNRDDMCASPLAPDLSFCVFKDYTSQCYGGLGFQTMKLEISESLPRLPPLALHRGQKTGTAAIWHPSETSGRQARSMKTHQNPEDYFSLSTLKAFSALAKLSYCGSSLGFASAVQSTCSGWYGVCREAGFGVVPETVRAIGVPYETELTRPHFMVQTLFFYTALIRRTHARFAEAPYFMPSEACVLIFRGANNEQNTKMNRQLRQVPLNDTKCGNCTMNQGILSAWKLALQQNVLDALKQSGCAPKPDRERVGKVFIAGHSMGGTLATMASYFLHQLNFAVQLSWSIEGGRPGSPALMDYIDTVMFAHERPVSLWQVTHGNDKVPRTPRSVFAHGHNAAVGRHRFQAFFGSSDLRDATLCVSKLEAGKDSDCGIYQFDRLDLETNLPSAAHCGLPFAPGGEMCMLPWYPAGTPYALASQCYIGGSLATELPAETGPRPPVGRVDEFPTAMKSATGSSSGGGGGSSGSSSSSTTTTSMTPTISSTTASSGTEAASSFASAMTVHPTRDDASDSVETGNVTTSVLAVVAGDAANGTIAANSLAGGATAASSLAAVAAGNALDANSSATTADDDAAMANASAFGGSASAVKRTKVANTTAKGGTRRHKLASELADLVRSANLAPTH